MEETMVKHVDPRTQVVEGELSFNSAKELIIKQFAKGILEIKGNLRKSAIFTPAEEKEFFEVVQQNLITHTTQAINVAESFVINDVFLANETVPSQTELLDDDIEDKYISYLNLAEEVNELLPELAEKRAEICHLNGEIEELEMERKYEGEKRGDEDVLDTVGELKGVELKIAEITRRAYYK